MRPVSARRPALHAARRAGLALLLPLVALAVLGGCSQPPATPGALVCTPVDDGDRGLKSALIQQSVPLGEDPICGRWPRVCD
jgi:hypothetical protein